MNLDLKAILSLSPYSVPKEEKNTLLTSCLKSLSSYHYQECNAYRKMMDTIGFNPNKINSFIDIPLLPVRLFKMMELQSIEKNNVFKTMTSSGTSGQAVSRIYIDKETAANQTKVLTKIVSLYLGSKRLFALDEIMELKTNEIIEFTENH